MPRVRYLLLAAAIHLTLTITIFFIGHFQLLPEHIDRYGTGLTFAIDGTTYHKVAGALSGELESGGIAAWLAVRAPFHSRLQSLAFATFGRLVGHNILALEPLNLFFYLGILSCLYLIGREVFNERAGFVAASIAGVWPTFLIYSTQFMRDSLAILCFLSLMLVLVLLLSREFSMHHSLGLGIGGALALTLFWITRGNMWNVVLVAIAITLLLLVFLTIREKRLMWGNNVAMLVVIGAALTVPTRIESTTLPGVRPPATALAIPSASQPAPPEGIRYRVIKQIADRRAGSRLATARASDIDSHVRFSGAGDIARFLPRAAVIGFFAPFPKMWFETGNAGRAARLLSGVEMLAMYFLYPVVGLTVWRGRKDARVWLLFLAATIGMLALGLVVVNAGALFRLRYLFWMLLLILAAGEIQNWLSKKSFLQD